MEKIKDFIYKTNKILLPFSIIFFAIVFTVHFILKKFDLQFTQWVYETAIVILMISISIRIIEIFIKQSKKIKRYICAILVTLCIIFWKKIFFILFYLLIIVNIPSEHIVERQGSKYVAEVDMNFLHTTVYFYKYVNFFVRSTEVEFKELYNGAYDPIIRERQEQL